MKETAPEKLLSPSDIAELAGVSRAAVSNWRRRSVDFPQPIGGSELKPLFSQQAVTEWLQNHVDKNQNSQLSGKGEFDPSLALWASVNAERQSLNMSTIEETILRLAESRIDGTAIEAGAHRLPDSLVENLEPLLASIPADQIADTVDDFLARSAKSRGRLSLEMGSPNSRISLLLANLVAPMRRGDLYDPACGIATAVVEGIKLGARPSRVILHEVNRTTLDMARIRAKLRGIDAETQNTDVLVEDISPDLKADLIVAEPPFGLRMPEAGKFSDRRYIFGTPSAMSADFAWIQHVISHLSENGVGYVVTSMSATRRVGDDAHIRAKLAFSGCLEAVVALPGKMSPAASIPLALWVLRPLGHGKRDSIRIIDATEADNPELAVAKLLVDGIKNPKISEVEASVSDLFENNASLAPEYWFEPEPATSVDLEEFIKTSLKTVLDNTDSISRAIASFSTFTSGQQARILSLKNLMDLGLIDIRTGRSHERYEDFPTDLANLFVTASDVKLQELKRSDHGITDLGDLLPEMTRSNDVLVTTMNAIRTLVDNTGGHIPTTGVHRIRINYFNELNPEYLAWALKGSWNMRFMTGATIQKAQIRNLEIPIPDISEQLRIVSTLDQISKLRDQSDTIVRSLDQLQVAVLDSIRFGAS